MTSSTISEWVWINTTFRVLLVSFSVRSPNMLKADHLGLDNLPGGLSLDKNHSSSVSSQWLPTVRHLEMQPCEISPSTLDYDLGLSWCRLVCCFLGTVPCHIQKILSHRRCSGPLALITLPPPRPRFLSLKCTSCVADKSTEDGHQWSAVLCIFTNCGFLWWILCWKKEFFFILDESYIYLWIYEQIFRKQLVITLVQKRWQL